MRTIILAAALSLAASLPISAQAPASSARPEIPEVRTTCPQCVEQARAVNTAYGGLSFLWDRKESLERSIAIVQKIVAERAQEIAKLEAATPRSGRTQEQQQAIDKLKELNAAHQSGVERSRRELAEVEQRIVEQNHRIAELSAKLAECEKRCQTPPADPPVSATAGPSPQIKINPDGTLSFVVPCPRCQRYADRIMALNEERAEYMEELAELQLAFSFVASGGTLKFKTDKTFASARLRAMDLLDAMDEVMSDIASVDAELAGLWRRFLGCMMYCNSVAAVLWSRPLFYGPAIGVGVLGGALITGGGSPTTGAPPVSTAPPPPPVTTAPSPPSPTPAPPTQPTTPTAAGRYRCVATAVVSDNGRHNGTINLGAQLTGDFAVSDDGGLAIRHGTPFVDIVNAQYDRATGRFTGESRGTVAGFPNVGVRAEGMVDLATGRIQFNYTMGTGGELPGGQAITYAITLQRQ